MVYISILYYSNYGLRMLKFPEMLNNPNCLVTEAMSVLCVLVTGAAVWLYEQY